MANVQVHLLDGHQLSVDENDRLADSSVQSLNGVTAGTALASKYVKLDANKAVDVVRTASLRLGASGSETAVTADAAELNIMDGVLATTAEINRACDVSTRIVTLIATGAITEALHEGKTCLLTVAGASATYTLPAATGGGARYRFVVGEVNTSNYVIKSVAGADVMQGTILGASTTDSATDAARTWRAGTTDDTITLNGTTTGGVDLGDWIELEDISATAWFVRGFVTQSGSEATMFSDTVA